MSKIPPRNIPPLRKNSKTSTFTARLPEETFQEQAHFLRYLTLPVPRKVSRYKRAFPEFCGDLNVEKLRACAYMNRWAERAECYDIVTARGILNGIEEYQLKRIQRLWDIHEKAAVRTLETIATTTHGAASKTFFEALKQLRLEGGESTERTETVERKELSFDKLSKEDFKVIRKAGKKLEVVK